jgi:two-component system OmpR family response regulator
MPKILLIEDQPQMRQNVALILELNGFEVVVAEDGKQGLMKARAERPDLILCDVMMPELDGYGVLHLLRKVEAMRSVPFIFLTAKGEKTEQRTGMNLGADDYLIKPFDLDEIFARGRALIRRAAGVVSNVMQIGPVRINVQSRAVSLGGKAVLLTPREYVLLEFLAMHRGEVVTRTTLYEHLFDENEITLSNLLDVHISNLRGKLGADFIVTRRGHGYSIE